MDVQVPLRDADGEVAQRVRLDVDATTGESLALLCRERAVIADEISDRVGHQ
jgi:hypothetical protein